ncbi:MAG TPA: S24 family peptidase [Mesorhizobium sp.]|jgi:phage repressor protein C with HTH and peptisase S24 domain|uniref:S24 family peptidase n=1 Tax=Mesorhizobium sp. TaxID=1871066 RepID=UPI002DDCC1F0|nr:S24 family peptidase [Mesorhizobium sp.]HEV2501453.1 S24 family peptidase [Mesorhizobium sp.]
MDTELFPYRQRIVFRDTENRFADKIPHMPTDFQMRVRIRMAELNLSARATSLAADLSPDAVGKMLKEGAGLPRGDSLTGLAKALRTTEQWLISGPDGQQPPRNVEDSSATHSSANVDEVEIKATAAGSHDHGAIQLFDNAIGYAPLPRGLKKQTGVYALVVINDSMWPEHKPGAIRFVTPGIPPRIGDSVVVEFIKDPEVGPEAMIGHLNTRGETIKLGKLNPPAEIEIPARAILKLHRIASDAETA